MFNAMQEIADDAMPRATPRLPDTQSPVPALPVLKASLPKRGSKVAPRRHRAHISYLSAVYWIHSTSDTGGALC